jgi:hypothetical protein
MVRRNFWIGGLSALIPLFAAGCGGQASRDLTGSSGGSGGSAAATGESGARGTTGTAATWVTDLNAAYCTWAIRCGRFPDAASCNALRGPQFAAINFNAPSAAIRAVSKGTSTFDPTQATSCLAALSNLDCDSDLFGGARVPASCAGVFSGTVSDGSACIDDVECASGSMCVIASTATCEGVCTPASGGLCRTSDDCPAQQYCAAGPIGGSGLAGSGSCQALIEPGANAGDPCGTPVQCVPGLRCFGPIAPVHCVVDAASPAGAACGGEGPDCAPGLVCVTSDDGTTATCAPPAKLGEACTSLFQCGAQYDLSDLICDESHTHACVHRPSTGPCKVVDRINTCDPASSFCDAASATCKPWLSQGSSCVFPSSGIDPCAPGNSCGSSVCASLLTACTPE